MDVYSNYDETLKNWSNHLLPWHGLVYCLTICKRSAPLYYDFVERENWGDKEAVALSHELLTSAITGVAPNSETLENCIERLEAFTPDTEDFNDCDYATDVGIIHIYSAELLRKHNPENIYYVARNCYDIVDNQVSRILMPNGGVMTSFSEKEVERHDFIQDEMAWQRRVRNELAQLSEGDASKAEAKISEWIKTPLLR